MADKLDTKENYMAERLRACCSPWGVERQSKLKESASILIDMGSLYIEKTKSCSGMKKKLTFIKCAALICGARVRFQKHLSDSCNAIRCEGVFKDMCNVLLAASGAKSHDADLFAISQKVAALLKQIRGKEKEFIKQKLPPISDEIPQSELIVKQKERINVMRTLLKENTAYYKAIMKYISEECIKVLGSPPCKFCIVGLGSLPREEVTLYSDFEHVILLDPGSDELNDEVREYFRWYAVIFQVIIIALGETYIPTVGVESLNDLYSEDKGRSWFFDLYTPGGVSFDGRFPHSCKSPLGKQEPSARRKHVVELIQPVDKMLQYLTSQEDRDNGYHLRDILIRTCLVHGDKDLYLDFKRRTSPIITRETRNLEVLEQAEFVVKNVNSLLSASSVNLEKMDFERIKDFFYRPVTVLVGCLARICRKATGSNLDFFPWFRQIIGKELASTLKEYLHNLEYAVAVACEIRLKAYAFAGKQKQKMKPSEVSKFIGKRCLVGCLRTVQTTSVLFHAIWMEKAGFTMFFQLFAGVASKNFSPSALMEANICEIFGYHEDALKAYQRVEMEHAVPPSSYFKAGVFCRDRRDEYFRKAEELFSNKDEAQEMSFDYLDTMCQIYIYQGRNEYCFHLLDNWTKKYRSENKPVKSPEYQGLQQMKASVLGNAMSPEEVVLYADSEIASSEDVVSQIAFRIQKAVALLLLGNLCTAKDVLAQASRHCANRLCDLPLSNSLSFAGAIFCVQTIQAWNEDAAETMELLDILQGTKEINETSRNLFNLNSSMLLSKKPEDVTAAMQYLGDHLASEYSQIQSKGSLLGLLLEQRGISNFYEIAQHFESVTEEVLLQPAVHNNLNAALQKYYEKTIDCSYHEIGRDMQRVFAVFSPLFDNPRYIGTLRDISVCVVTKSLDLKMANERRALAHQTGHHRGGNLAYNIALQKFGALEAKSSASLFWKVLHCNSISERIKCKSWKLLVHITSFSSFGALINYLEKQRPRFIERLSFSPTTSSKLRYNKTVRNFVALDTQSSARGFWKMIFESNSESTLQKRSVEMLMFTILVTWECEGYPMHVGNRYVSNKPVRLTAPGHVKLGDFYPLLKLTSEEIEIALRKAALTLQAKKTS